MPPSPVADGPDAHHIFDMSIIIHPQPPLDVASDLQSRDPLIPQIIAFGLAGKEVRDIGYIPVLQLPICKDTRPSMENLHAGNRRISPGRPITASEKGAKRARTGLGEGVTERSLAV